MKSRNVGRGFATQHSVKNPRLITSGVIDPMTEIWDQNSSARSGLLE
jgi:hypothetical protein